MSKFPIGAHGGYRRTYSFSLACLIYHATTTFCRRNLNHQNDSLGKIAGQMIGAARSARQNIVEGSSRAGTSRETELKLYDVARGSLDELAGDYEVFLEESNALPWTPASPEADEFLKIKFNPFEFQGDEAQERHEYARFFQTIRQFFSPWIENEDSIRAANSILLLIDQARRLLAKQIVSITVAITEQGGFTEQLSHARIAKPQGEIPGTRR